MITSRSDALVFFGATGDLAFKKIFPALQAMLKRGNLNVPVIGVARSAADLAALKARAYESLQARQKRSTEPSPCAPRKKPSPVVTSTIQRIRGLASSQYIRSYSFNLPQAAAEKIRVVVFISVETLGC